MFEQERAKQLTSVATTKLSESLEKNHLADTKIAQVVLSADSVKLQETSA